MDYSKFSGSSNYVYLPKIGESGTFGIVKMYFGKAKDNKYNFSMQKEIVLPDGTTAVKHEPILNPETNEPFNLQCELDDGKTLSCSSFAAFMQVFKHNDIQDGDKVQISHPKKGEWIVEKIGKAEIIDEIPF